MTKFEALPLAMAGSLTLMACMGANTAAAAAESAPVFDEDGITATAYSECDATPYVRLALARGHDPEAYAAYDKFAEKVDPHLGAIIEAAVAWVTGPGNEGCDSAVAPETMTVIGVIGALPVYASAASAADGWQPGSATPDARSVAAFAAALPPADPQRCATFQDTVMPELSKIKTKLYTARAAATTGQWSEIQGLDAVSVLHGKLMPLVAEWGFDWECPAVFSLTQLAVVTDLERAGLLGSGEKDLKKLIDAASTPEERTAVMEAHYRSVDLPPIKDMDELVVDVDGKPTMRFGGYRYSAVERTEAAFAP